MALGSEAVSEAVKAQFAGFELDVSSGELIRNGQRHRLQGQPFLVLRVLIDHAGEVVTREELQRRLWPDETFVDFDHGLNKAIAKLREALEDQKNGSGLIQTLPRRGYRFAAEVRWIAPEVAPPAETVRLAPDEVGSSQPSISIRVRFAFALVSVFVLALTFWLNRHTVSGWFGGRAVIQSVAVMPFVNLSNDPGQDYFADGMAEELTTDLSYAKSLRVVSRSSTAGFRKSGLSVPQIADQLHVDAVIEGTVLRVDNRVRVTIRLTTARPERQVWAQSYERDLTDAIALQNRIATDAVAQIRTQVSPEQQTRLNLESRISPEAYDEYLRARFFLGQETAQGDKAIPHLERAIQLDPNFAAAYAALGEAWGMQGVWGEKSNQVTSAEALEYSRKAVSLDPASSEAYSSLGHSLMQSRRWNEGEVALRRALELDPNNPNAAEYLAQLLAQKGRTDEAVTLIRELAAANPVALDVQRTYAEMLYRDRRYDEAIAQCRRILELDPNHLATYTTYANALVETGRYPEAEAAFTRGKFMDPGVQAWLDVREGKPWLARQILQRNPSLVNVHSAVARYLLGAKAVGLFELDFLANEKWAVKTYHLRNDPTFDAMRSDPGFNAIVKKTGLLDN